MEVLSYFLSFNQAIYDRYFVTLYSHVLAGSLGVVLAALPVPGVHGVGVSLGGVLSPRVVRGARAGPRPRVAPVRAAAVRRAPVPGVTSRPGPRARGPQAGLVSVVSAGTPGTPRLSVDTVTCRGHVRHVWVAPVPGGRSLLPVSEEEVMTLALRGSK